MTSSFTERTVCFSSPKPRESCTSRAPPWHHTPAPRGPRAASADANRGLWLLQAPPVYLCHAAAPLRSVKILLPRFSAPFGESLSVSLTANHTTPLAALPWRWWSGDTNTSVQTMFSYNKDGLALKTQLARAAEPRWPLLGIPAWGATQGILHPKSPQWRACRVMGRGVSTRMTRQQDPIRTHDGRTTHSCRSSQGAGMEQSFPPL